MRLVLFDLDDTLFNGDTEAEWVFYMINNGLIKDQQEFETSMENFEKLYRKGELDVLQYSKFLLSPLKGRSLSSLNHKIEEFAKTVSDKLSDKLTIKLLNKHKLDQKILTSGSLSFLVNKIALNLGIEQSFGTDAELSHDIFTGAVSGIPNFSDEKVRRIKTWMNSKDFETIYAYSDSIFDLPLLNYADVPIAVNPDKKLRKEAEKNSWTIEDTRADYS